MLNHAYCDVVERKTRPAPEFFVQPAESYARAPGCVHFDGRLSLYSAEGEYEASRSCLPPSPKTLSTAAFSKNLSQENRPTPLPPMLAL